MKKLYAFHWDCGRMGELDGLFVATDEVIEIIVGKVVNFGEVLGKHSDVYGTLKDSDLRVSSEDPAVIAWFEREFKYGFGHQPISQLRDEGGLTDEEWIALDEAIQRMTTT